MLGEFLDNYRRFIPTLVGNGGYWKFTHVDKAVHPHARGEREKDNYCNYIYSGSSPRSWGTGISQVVSFRLFRFIPTLVGNGNFPPAPPMTSPVHPHARGERSTGASVTGSVFGSSPRSWGTALHICNEGFIIRFIPTLVGNGKIVARIPIVSPVHPHARGERLKQRLPDFAVGGSSPRSWGTGRVELEKLLCVRFIPTLVGNGMLLLIRRR